MKIFQAILEFFKKLFGRKPKAKVHKPADHEATKRSINLGSRGVNFGNIGYKMSCRSNQRKRRQRQRRTGNYKR
jgi:hypothetical protein